MTDPGKQEQQMPERAWLCLHPERTTVGRHDWERAEDAGVCPGNTEYVRADLYEQAVRERDEAVALLRDLISVTGAQDWGPGARFLSRLTPAHPETKNSTLPAPPETSAGEGREGKGE